MAAVVMHVEYPPAELELLRRAAFGRCRAAGASVEDAQDCAQDAIASLLAHPAVEHPSAWVATVAYHRYVDLCRLRRREGSAGLVPTAAAAVPAPGGGPEDEVVGRAHARWLVGAMRRLPASTRTVCSALGTGVPRQEVAGRLGLTDRAVESHLTRARRSLRTLSLLSAAALVASARLLRRLLPAAKPAAAALVVPPVALVVVLSAGPHPWTRPHTAPPGADHPTAVQPAGPEPAAVPPAVAGHQPASGTGVPPGNGGAPGSLPTPAAPSVPVPDALPPAPALPAPELPRRPDAVAVTTGLTTAAATVPAVPALPLPPVPTP